MQNIELTSVKQPKFDHLDGSIFLTDETIEERKQKILVNMQKANLDKLVVYG